MKNAQFIVERDAAGDDLVTTNVGNGVTVRFYIVGPVEAGEVKAMLDRCVEVVEVTGH